MNKLIAILFSLLPLTALAQKDDFGLDLSAGVEEKLSKTIDFEGGMLLRTQDNSRRLERFGIEAGFSWKFVNTKTLDMKLGISGSAVNKLNLSDRSDKYDIFNMEDGTVVSHFKGYNQTEKYWRGRTRENISLSASYKPNKRWAFSIKETMQFNQYHVVDSVNVEKWRFNDDDELYKRDDKKHVERKDRTVLRSKVAVQYNVRRSPFSPYVSVDHGCGINYTATKWKFTVGTDLKLNKTNKLDVFYRLQTEDDDDEPNGHILGVAYTIKL